VDHDIGRDAIFVAGAVYAARDPDRGVQDRRGNDIDAALIRVTSRRMVELVGFWGLRRRRRSATLRR
jgi:hypothetical protein